MNYSHSMIKKKKAKNGYNTLDILLEFSVEISSKIREACSIHEMYYFWLHLISEFERCEE